MSNIKRWIEDHIDELTDEELIEGGWDPEAVELMREAFGKQEEES